ncbi:MAG: response regulator transcription factor [Alphaproteobacteria bacterium]|nr:response regulator transcription factor [Alphaproteobacteria bacterium]
MTDPRRIAVIEDDPQLRRFLKTGLEAHGFEVTAVETGREGLAMLVAQPADVLLLDLMLPDADGADLVREIRGWSQVPIIVLSSKSAAQDKIDLLDLGANDYLAKPFDMGELLARIRAALRQGIVAKGSDPVFKSGALRIDLVRHVVTVDGKTIHLSPREFALLRYMAQHADKVITHQMILKEVWGAAHLNDTHYLRVFVGRLRQKLEADPARPRLLVTVSGVGYRLCRIDD